jgi:hypothetical protein
MSSASSMRIVKGTKVSLRSLGIDEASLENFICSDATVLGLGDVRVVERQRRQQNAGRLDLLLEGTDEDVRYEVELMLGATDESHLIRTIEYWDIERRRYPAYDHRAVLIAEDITTRFLNVITLFSGSIPIIAIQANAVVSDNSAAVTFLRVVDSTALRRDDSADVKLADRDEWVARAGVSIVELADRCLSFINEVAKPQLSLNYAKTYIGLTDGTQSNDSVWFSPKKSFLRVSIMLDPIDSWTQRVKDADLDFKIKDGYIRVDLSPKEFADNKDLLREMLHEAETKSQRK